MLLSTLIINFIGVMQMIDLKDQATDWNKKPEYVEKPIESFADFYNFLGELIIAIFKCIIAILILSAIGIACIGIGCGFVYYPLVAIAFLLLLIFLAGCAKD
jgi:hypothetical protein